MIENDASCQEMLRLTRKLTIPTFYRVSKITGHVSEAPSGTHQHAKDLVPS
jgi:hypothetical protein